MGVRRTFLALIAAAGLAPLGGCGTDLSVPAQLQFTKSKMDRAVETDRTPTEKDYRKEAEAFGR